MGNQQGAPTLQEVEAYLHMHQEYQDGIDKAREWLANNSHLMNQPDDAEQLSNFFQQYSEGDHHHNQSNNHDSVLSNTASSDNRKKSSHYSVNAVGSGDISLP